MKTDAQLHQDVSAELEWEPAVHAAAIGVEVNDGIVTLSGHLRSHAEKLAAERAAERVAGVRGVVVQLEVRPGEAIGDEALAQAAHAALQWQANLPAGAIKVRVEKGWITLSGEVEWGYQRALAERTVSHLRGVTGLHNYLTVQSRMTPPDVARRIEAALCRHAQREARHIDVRVEHGVVTLSGQVDSLAERDATVGAAWSAPGVVNVIDELRVNGAPAAHR
ncbi:OsmY domain-containing protein [Cupriavidus sp. USMAA2-4]|uniref:OsmY domain-containing protein n=1 Tax=Cupriavidus malaysiensis TaxID=367825 RepID=A0ABN4TVK5_9BURK|nr:MULTISPECIES: BON domain-containing protein [Cupriavidus]AOY95034.1 OsmY domain-containing protein [Cupriavidus sp. USMAA2-4]AOZ02072.1 OsmY domain-containing protein [Cupriavidus sp. USMAHM13]AOZ10539.1 OsmY domain-containing protein [Cupriavidus malaysiensis]